MLVKIHKSYRDVIAICDSELLGRIFEEGNRQINVKESFFDGEEMTTREVVEVIKKGIAEDSTFNIVGNKSTNLAVQEGLISKEGIIKVQHVPVALVLL